MERALQEEGTACADMEGKVGAWGEHGTSYETPRVQAKQKGVVGGHPEYSFKA